MSSTPGSTHGRSDDELRAAFAELSHSLQHLKSVLVDFQHHLLEVQMNGGSEHAGAALMAARAAIFDAARAARG